jgi:hypothetical protein
MTDVASSTSALSKSIQLLNADADGLVQKFGELSDGSKVWNIASRLLSGSGLWQLQNRIRAMGNIVSVWNKASNAQLENQLKAVDAAQQLGAALKDLTYEMDNIKDSDYYKATKDGLIAKGYTKEKAALLAKTKVQKQYSSVIKNLKGKLGGSGKAGISDFINEGHVQEFGKFRNRNEKGQFAKGSSWRNKMTKAGAGGYTMNQLSRVFTKMKWTKEIIKQTSMQERGKAMQEWFKKKGKKFGRMVDVGVSLMMKLLIYLGLATLVIFILRKAWGPAKKFLARMGGLEKQFNQFKDGVMQVLTGLWDVFGGLFQGDFGRVWKGLRGILSGLWKILIASLVTMGKLILAGIVGVAKAIGKAIKDKIPFLSTGGSISSGGMAVVGERGPELVNLPRGATVYSNAQSKTMGGNNIHVHVNGRVGASDAEIRDIANKVAREINMRMNRTSNTVGGF